MLVAPDSRGVRSAARVFLKTMATLGVFSLVVAALSAAPALAADAPSARFVVDPEDSSRARLVIDVPAPRWDRVGGGFVPRIDGFGVIGEAGLPDLPLRLERVALGDGQTVTIESVDIAWFEGRVPGPVLAYPANDPRTVALDASGGEGAPWPEEPVTLRSTDGRLRDQRFATLAVAPMQVDLAQGTFRIARTIAIDLRFENGLSRMSAVEERESSPLFSRLAARTLHGAPAPVGEEALVPSRPSLRSSLGVDAGARRFQLVVDREGLYRVTHAWLQANAPNLLAFLQGEDPRRIRLSTQGVEVPILVEGEADGVFGAGDAIVFFGQPIDGDPFSPDGWQQGDYTDRNVYTLDVADGPARVTDNALVAPPTIGVVPPSFRDTARYEDNSRFTNFVPLAGGDHWVADPFVLAGATENLDQPVSTPGHVGGSVRVRARLMGFERLHQTQIRVDGVLRDTKNWDGPIDFTHDISFDRTATPLAATTIVNVAITNARQADQIAVNWAEVEYDRAYAAESSRLLFEVANAQNYEVRLGSFGTSLEVWEVTDTVTSAAGLPVAIPRRVDGIALRDGKPAFDVFAEAAPRRFAAAESTGFLALPSADSVREDLDTTACASGSLRGAECGARWIVIGHASLLGGANLAALAARRDAQGYPAAIIDVQDIFDEFTYGIEDPEAIRLFLDHALAGGSSAGWSPAPEVVVLVGDGTYDSKNNYQHAVPRNLMPTYTIDFPSHPNYKLYTSDVWFAQVRGDDELPDAMVGRIPAHDLAEAETVFGKILDYEQGAADASWAGRALLVSEAPESTGDGLGGEFQRIHDGVFTSWYSNGPQTASKIYEANPWEAGCNAAATQMNLDFDAGANAGAALTTFLGHGSFRSWGKTCTYFETAPPAQQVDDDLNDIATGTPLQFQVHANCITGAFGATSSPGSSNDSWYVFMEDWLLTADKGAVAGIAPAHLSFDVVLEPIIQPVYSQIFGKTKERVAGVIDFAIRDRLEGQNFVSSLRSMIFFGDPLTTLAIPAPPAPSIVSISRDGSKALLVEWTSVAEAATYRVYRSTSVNGPYQLAGEVVAPVTSYRDTGLLNCNEYYYYVVALDDLDFESRWSNFNETCLGVRDPADCKAGIPEDPNPPPAPTWPSGTSGEPEPVRDLQQGGRLKVTWNAVDPLFAVQEYTVRWGTSAGGPYPSSLTTGVGNTSVTISGLEDGTEYFFVVQSAHCSDISTISEERSGIPHLVRGIDPPAAILDLFIAYVDDAANGFSDGAKDTRLAWGAPLASAWGLDTSVASYEVYGSSSGPVFRTDASTLLATRTASEPSWTHELAPASPKNWFYLVVAIDGDGLRSPAGAAFPESVSDLRLSIPESQPSLLRFAWTGVQGGLNGTPGPAIETYNLYGRDSLLPRAATGAINRLAAFANIGAGVEHTGELALPGAPFFTFQLLAQDYRGTEAVW